MSRQHLEDQVQESRGKLARSQLEQARMLREQSLVSQELELSKAVQESREHEDKIKVTELQRKLQSTEQEKKRLSELLEDRARHFCALCSSVQQQQQLRDNDDGDHHECSSLSSLSISSVDDNKDEEREQQEDQLVKSIIMGVVEARPQSWAPCTPPPTTPSETVVERVKSMPIDIKIIYKARAAVGDWM